MTAEYHLHPTRSSLSAPSIALLRMLRSTIGLFAAFCHIKIKHLLISAQNSAMLLWYIPFFEDNMTRSTPELSAAGSNRLVRLLRIAQEIRCYPQQTQEALQKKFGISRSQYYKDKAALAETGFCFTFNRKTGFRITEDRLTPITGLTLSDRLVLMFALEYLSSEGDGTLAALAVETGRKLAGGLSSPFREQLQQCFDSCITSKVFGAEPEVLQTLQKAVYENRRVRIFYTRATDWTERWRTIDPRRLYIRQHAIYVYARTADETPPAWKIFRLNRIKKAEPTDICFSCESLQDDGFADKQQHSFAGVFGDTLFDVTLRFTGNAMHYVLERQWHPSQQTRRSAHELLFSVRVSDPQEVVRWARQWENEMEVVSITPVSEE